jgi:hypothetical protein
MTRTGERSSRAESPTRTIDRDSRGCVRTRPLFGAALNPKTSGPWSIARLSSTEISSSRTRDSGRLLQTGFGTSRYRTDRGDCWASGIVRAWVCRVRISTRRAARRKISARSWMRLKSQSVAHPSRTRSSHPRFTTPCSWMIRPAKL